MVIQQYLANKKNQELLIKLVKIAVLGFTSFSLLASMIPFFVGYDEINYGLQSINLSQGSLTITNELLQDTGNRDFIPRAYVITSDNDSAVPKNNIGILVLGALSYLLGGYFGLFYIGPIFTILFLIIYERVASKFFGNLVGLFALLLMVADWQFYFIGLRFLTDNIFSLFFILGVFCMIKFIQNKNEKYILLCSTFFVLTTFIRINGIIFLFTEIIVISGFFIIQNLYNIRTSNNNSKIILKNYIFSKSNIQKFVKTSFFLIIPWLIFFAFWFSYNDYFFGEATTNYRDQIQSGSVTSEEQFIEIEETSPIFQNGALMFEFERLKLIQYFSTPLIPDPIYFFLIITSETDLNEWRSDIWISYIVFSVLAFVIIFSLYFKMKRKEILVLVLFIFSLVFFYSSPLGSTNPEALYLSETANNRYSLQASLLSFILIGFILIESWRKIFSKDTIKYKKLLNNLKIIYLILIVSFFSVLIVIMPSIQDLYQQGPHFNNPFQFTTSYEQLEKLPEKSLIVEYKSRKTLLHTDTHFTPYSRIFIENGTVDAINPTKLQTLKNLLTEGYSAYTYKNNMYSSDAKYFELIDLHHGIILKEYSDTFCKLELISVNETNDNKKSSDSICFEDVKQEQDKIWPVTLRWPF